MIAKPNDPLVEHSRCPNCGGELSVNTPARAYFCENVNCTKVGLLTMHYRIPSGQATDPVETKPSPKKGSTTA